ncbi:CDP-glucose 4,6-dehydratase [Oleispirillum naphthae]|uniref:CDP-glucose 4,6-dehydratase n=1 Tax=Oleispirillum naphthae TaxID=2838853 RepID=UPI0030825618
MTDLLSSYRGKRVLVTGHTGFKGSWLAHWLTLLGAEVTGFALPPEDPEAHFTALGLAGRIAHVEGDIRDAEAVRAVFARARPEAVFHLAAQAIVRRSYQAPKETFDTNAGGAVNLLEAARGAPGLRALVFITSDKCYRNKEWVWGYRETDELGGEDPYSASKAAAEMIFHAYAASFLDARADLGAATVRAGNVIGGGDWAKDRIVPDCIRALRAGRPIVLRNPEATRPWQHVLDPLRGYLTLGARLLADPARYRGSWNFGPEIGGLFRVRDIADLAVEVWGGNASVRIEGDPDAPMEHRLLQLAIDKAKLDLGWFPAWGTARAVRETVAWYRAAADGADVAETTTGQIARHMRDVEARPR